MKIWNSVIIAATATGLLSTSALAGGFDRGGVNIDQLFDSERFSARASVARVMPQRKLKNVQRQGNDALPATAQGIAIATAGGQAAFFAANPTPAQQQAAIAAQVPTALTLNPALAINDSSSSISVEGDYTVPAFGMKFSLTDDADCLATYTEPYGADADYGRNNAYSASAVSFEVETKNYGLTCSYKFAVSETSLGQSYIRAIGGVSYQELRGFQERQRFLDLANAGIMTAGGVQNTAGIGTFEADGEAYGYRVGFAYEIPAIALRAAVIYSSAYDYDLKGVQDNRGFGAAIPGTGVIPITASTEIPQAIEIRLQSGINERTLAYFNFKWQEWSKLGIIPIEGGRSPVDGQLTSLSFDPEYQDGYTISAGIGRVLTEDISVLGGIGWDRGTSTVTGSQTDTWSLSGGVSYKPTKELEINFGGLVGILTDGDSQVSRFGDAANAVTYDFDNDIVTALSLSAKLKF